MKILVVKLSAIGDVVQTLPAVEAIRRQYPQSHICWVVEEAAAGILEGHPAIDRLLISKRKTWVAQLKKPRSVLQGMRGILGFFRALRAEQFDLAIDFQGLLKSGMLMGLARAKRKIGFDGTRELSYVFLNERLPAYDKDRHALERYLDVARYLGVVDPSPQCSLPIEAEKRSMERKVFAIRGSGKRLVVINPVARWKTKLWPEEYFAELADRIVSEKNGVVIFTGGREARRDSQGIIARMRHPAIDWSGETSLKELAALSTLCDLFITTDTGPMHLAAAAGGRVLALFGPTAPWRTGPYGQDHIVVRTGVDCSPCFQRSCDKDHACMRGLTVSKVMDRLPW